MVIKAKCRVCGREADADSFKLDHYYKMMVCPECIRERRKREQVHKEVKEMRPEPKKPAGWDEDDEYLAKVKPKQKVAVVDLGGGKVKYKCPKCKYGFVYNIASKTPSRCPYCSRDVGPL